METLRSVLIAFLLKRALRSGTGMGKVGRDGAMPLKDAGFQPNQLTTARTREDLLSNLAALVRELGHFPVEGEIRLKHRSDRRFPSHSTFGKFGGVRALSAELERFCRGRGDVDLAELCAAAAKTGDAKDAENVTEDLVPAELGYVYLMKSGRFFKLIFYTMSAEVVHSRLVAISKTA
jgi:hypothetical protein